ncbi:hypothetical protein RUM43_008291 [Polyplax serrata]|uniref:Uncharacterized protein n=1 Tax=Polyplax serrata TaxID=468196 RepID=A0AAN8P2Y6_POLSC
MSTSTRSTRYKRKGKNLQDLIHTLLPVVIDEAEGVLGEPGSREKKDGGMRKINELEEICRYKRRATQDGNQIKGKGGREVVDLNVLKTRLRGFRKPTSTVTNYLCLDLMTSNVNFSSQALTLFPSYLKVFP